MNWTTLTMYALMKLQNIGVVIGMDFPGEEAQLQILIKLTRGCNIDVGVDMKKIDRSSQIFVTAYLAALVNKDRTHATNRHGVEELTITLADFEVINNDSCPIQLQVIVDESFHEFILFGGETKSLYGA